MKKFVKLVVLMPVQTNTALGGGGQAVQREECMVQLDSIIAVLPVRMHSSIKSQVRCSDGTAYPTGLTVDEVMAKLRGAGDAV